MGRFWPERRVRRRAEFQKAQRLGRKLVSRHVVLLVFARDGSDAGPARLGLLVSRRVGNAVRRNRTKRLIREAFRRCPLLQHPGTDLLAIARPGLAELDTEALIAELGALGEPLARRVAQARKDRENRRSRLAAGG